MEHDFYRYPSEELYSTMSVSELKEILKLGEQRVAFHDNETYVINLKIQSYENRLAELDPDYDMERYDEIISKILDLKEERTQNGYRRWECHTYFRGRIKTYIEKKQSQQ